MCPLLGVSAQGGSTVICLCCDLPKLVLVDCVPQNLQEDNLFYTLCMCIPMVTESLNANTCTIYFKQVTVHRFLSPKNKIVSCNLTWAYIVTPCKNQSGLKRCKWAGYRPSALLHNYMALYNSEEAVRMVNLCTQWIMHLKTVHKNFH